MLYVFLALQFLLRLRLRLKKSSGSDVTAGSDADAGGVALRRDDAGPCVGSHAVSQYEKLYRVSISSEKEIEISGIRVK